MRLQREISMPETVSRAVEAKDCVVMAVQVVITVSPLQRRGQFSRSYARVSQIKVRRKLYRHSASCCQFIDYSHFDANRCHVSRI